MTETAQKPLRMTAREFAKCMAVRAAGGVEKVRQRKPKPKPKRPRYAIVDIKRGAGGEAWAVTAAQCKLAPDDTAQLENPDDHSPIMMVRLQALPSMLDHEYRQE
jgi:hypothetical protein